MKEERTISLDGREYAVTVQRRVTMPVEAPRLIIVAYQPNTATRDILRICVQSLKQFTPEPRELWVVDNNSPGNNADWLLDLPDINVVINHTEPLPPDKRGKKSLFGHRPKQTESGSYANAVALELGIRCIDQASHYVMPLHQDIMAYHSGWLTFLMSKLDRKTVAAGVRMDKGRVPEGVLHVLGYLVDFRLFQKLGLDFMPELPRYDVGDRVTIALRKAGYEVFACHNSLWEPELVANLPPSLPLRNLAVDRTFDDNGNVIFLHLGRGVVKSVGRKTDKTTPAAWVRFGEEHLKEKGNSR